MADLTSLLREVKGVYSDLARDRLPNGSVWSMTDLIPEVLQAGARMRGAWIFQSSDVFANAPDGMLYAPYRSGARLLVAAGSDLRRVPEDAPGASTSIGAIAPTRQNPVFHRDRAIIPASDGVTAAKYVTFNGTVFTLTDAPGTALKGRYATVWKDRLILGSSAAEPQQIAFSKPGDPTVAWDSISLQNTALDLTGLAAQRTQILAFHASSVERVRGTIPPDSALSDPVGDLLLDQLWDKGGCYDARSIAYWQDNVLFCDARGIHLTDGAIVRNMTVQGGIINLWHESFKRGGNDPLSIAGGVHQDYYVCTVRSTGYPPSTFVVHIPTRRAFLLSNIDASTFAFSVGTAEKLFGSDTAAKRVVDLTPAFFPDDTILQVDGDGDPVLPVIETRWDTLTRKQGFKRIVDLHLSYLAVRDDDVEVLRAFYANRPTGDDILLGEFRSLAEYGRLRLPVRRPMEGIAVKLQQMNATKDTRLFEISVRAYPEEQNKLRVA
jgi:hypothetical protein